MINPNGAISGPEQEATEVYRPDDDVEEVVVVECVSEGGVETLPDAGSQEKKVTAIISRQASPDTKKRESIKLDTEAARDVETVVSGKFTAAGKFLDAGAYEDALVLAQEAIKETPHLSKAKLVMAEAFIGLGAHNKALATLQSLTKAEETSEALYLRGIACLKVHREVEALRYLQASVSAEGGDPRKKARARELMAWLKRGFGPENENTTIPSARPKPLKRRKRRRRGGCLSRFLLLLCLLLLVVFGAWILHKYGFIDDLMPKAVSTYYEQIAKFVADSYQQATSFATRVIEYIASLI